MHVYSSGSHSCCTLTLVTLIRTCRHCGSSELSPQNTYAPIYTCTLQPPHYTSHRFTDMAAHKKKNCCVEEKCSATMKVLHHLCNGDVEGFFHDELPGFVVEALSSQSEASCAKLPRLQLQTCPRAFPQCGCCEQ